MPHSPSHLEDLEGNEVLEQHCPPLFAVLPGPQLDQPRLKPDVPVQVKALRVRPHVRLDLQAGAEEKTESSAGRHYPYALTGPADWSGTKDCCPMADSTAEEHYGGQHSSGVSDLAPATSIHNRHSDGR